MPDSDIAQAGSANSAICSVDAHHCQQNPSAFWLLRWQSHQVATSENNKIRETSHSYRIGLLEQLQAT